MPGLDGPTDGTKGFVRITHRERVGECPHCEAGIFEDEQIDSCKHGAAHAVCIAREGCEAVSG